MNDTLLISLLVCTHNRASLLPQTIESLLSQRFDWGDYEIVVVDNASTDDTGNVVQNIQQHYPRVRYVHEPTLGVAVARNTGAREARADYVAYFDDDVIAHSDCLQHLMTPFFKANPIPAAVMGQVDLLWEGERPAWFPERFETLLSRFDRGNEPRFMTPDEYLLTTNVAFERQTFLKTGGIRADLSRVGRMFICGGDTEIFKRYMRLGYPVYYEPRARIRHLVPPSRQTRRWLLKRLFGDGTTQAVMVRILGTYSRKEVLRQAYFDLRRTTRFGLEFAAHALARHGPDAEDALYKFVQRLGRLTANVQLLFRQRVYTASES